MSSSRPPAQRVVIEPGTKLDHYELLCSLAHGGMANIWLGRVQEHGLEKFFAIKTILPNVSDDPVFKSMFLDEARIASRVEHPNVVHITDVGEFHGTPYLVMDLVDGEPLYKLPRACEKANRRMPLGIVLRILADACHGLHAAHELCDEMGNSLNVVHRDISPQNILVSTTGVSKVIDFGVAKARDRTTSQTSAGTLKGKISYMPHEQALGREVDRRSDTWAFGALLYWLIAGRPPYKEENQLATLQLAMSAAPIPPLPDNVPMALRSTIMRALAHDPSERFQTAASLGEVLEDLMRRLRVVTSHADVGAFIQQLMGDKIAARRQLIATAVAEAANRERVREALLIPIDDSDHSTVDSSSIDKDLVDLPGSFREAAELTFPEPTAATLVAAPTEGSMDATTTAGTFVAASAAAERRPRRWSLVLVGAAGFLGIVGVVLIVVSLKMGTHPRSGPASAALTSGTAKARVVAPPPTSVPPPASVRPSLPPTPSSAAQPATSPSAPTAASGALAAKSTPPPPPPPRWKPAAPPPTPQAAPTQVPKAAASTRHKRDDDPGF